MAYKQYSFNNRKLCLFIFHLFVVFFVLFAMHFALFRENMEICIFISVSHCSIMNLCLAAGSVACCLCGACIRIRTFFFSIPRGERMKIRCVWAHSNSIIQFTLLLKCLSFTSDITMEKKKNKWKRPNYCHLRRWTKYPGPFFLHLLLMTQCRNPNGIVYKAFDALISHESWIGQRKSRRGVSWPESFVFIITWGNEHGLSDSGFCTGFCSIRVSMEQLIEIEYRAFSRTACGKIIIFFIVCDSWRRNDCDACGSLCASLWERPLVWSKCTWDFIAET